MKQIQDTEVQGEVDKKSGTGIVKVSSKAPEVRGLSAAASLDVIDTTYVYINVDRTMTLQAALDLVLYIADELDINRVMLGDVGVEGKHITFQVGSGSTYNSTQLATSIQEDLADKIKDKYGVHVLSTGIGHSKNELQISPVGKVLSPSDSTTIAVVVTVTVILCVVVIMLITWRCMYSKWHHSLDKFDSLSTTIKGESTQDSYEDLCRQRMQTTNDGSAVPAPSDSELDRVSPLKSKSDMSGAHAERLRSPRSSTSSWSEEPVNLAMDISTGHTILNYMESHLKNSKKLDEEWTALESYVPDRCDVESGKLHPSKNRYPTILPYDHNRVKLGHIDENNDDYINASFVADHDRRSPAYVVTQGPLQSTVGQFWQMVWEQDCTSIVMLTSLAEENKTVCYQYWPSDGREVYGKNFEVMLVSEHSWCETYLVRNMYLKNLSTNQTRTVTQFHFLSWPISSVPEDSPPLSTLSPSATTLNTESQYFTLNTESQYFTLNTESVFYSCCLNLLNELVF
ncbi:PTPRN2 [Bugula neritina]|uniref:PTPRN2 n=1 Tax=Bugula neritina TaxID=10212 RepID=A0A7J7KB34_BUGNE|nr:PTPRN2 [Bugula neritina]